MKREKGRDKQHHREGLKAVSKVGDDDSSPLGLDAAIVRATRFVGLENHGFVTEKKDISRHVFGQRHQCWTKWPKAKLSRK